MAWLIARARRLRLRYVYWRRRVYARRLKRYSKAFARSVTGPLKPGDLISTTITGQVKPEGFYVTCTTVVSGTSGTTPPYSVELPATARSRQQIDSEEEGPCHEATGSPFP